MYESHEAMPWGWDDDWRLGVVPLVSITFEVAPGETGTSGELLDRKALSIRGISNPDYSPGDRPLWWRYCPEVRELHVRVPREPSQGPTEGLWIEKCWRLTDDGRIVPTGEGHTMDFSGRDPWTSEVLSKIGLRGVDTQIARELRVIARRLGLGDEWERASAQVKRPGRAGMPPAELAVWAKRYVEALTEDERRPYAVLKDRYPGWSDSGLKSIVRRARKAGLLTEVRQGQTGGELTDRARELLEEGI